MILGMSLAAFTLVHVLISLVAIVAGLIVLLELLTSKSGPGWTALFLLTTVLTSVTGFLFPVTALLPSHIVGIISLVLLAIALVALYAKHLTGAWRGTYVVTAMLALYLNVFVLLIQAFQKIGPLKQLAPTQTEQPFLLAQGLVLAFFGMTIAFAVLRYRPASRPAD